MLIQNWISKLRLNLIQAFFTVAVLASAAIAHADDDAVLVDWVTFDTVIVQMNQRMVPVRLLGVNAPGNWVFKGQKVVSTKSSFETTKFVGRFRGAPVRLEYEQTGKNDPLQKDYLAAWVWIDGERLVPPEVIIQGGKNRKKEGARLLNAEIIARGFARPVPEGKYGNHLPR